LRVTDEVRNGIIELLPRLRRFAYALSGNPDQGDDLVQEACARALAHPEQYKSGTRLDSWMYRIVRNIWLDQLRASKVRGYVMDLDAAPEMMGEDGRNIIESRLTLRQVLNAMGKLPPQQRLLIALVCFEGVSYQNAADILEIPIGTVTSRLVRARRLLCALAVDGTATMGNENAKADR
jgi:RNA polymerase sigma-70 factor (ECF subfamily)